MHARSDTACIHNSVGGNSLRDVYLSIAQQIAQEGRGQKPAAPLSSKLHDFEQRKTDNVI
jgi:hypothetical protein